MSVNFDYHYVKQVSLLGSTICDLKCSYCYLREQHHNSIYNVMNREIKKAWATGEYFSNVKKVFETIRANPKNVVNFELWGGEPLIQLEDIIPTIGKFITFFPNISYFLIPTNWANTNIENLYKFILEIDKNKPIDTDQLQLHLQMSIDGPPGPFNRDGHAANWDNYKKNISLFCQKMSNIKLNNTKVIFEIHATASKANIFMELDNEEKMRNYLVYMNNFVNFIQDEIKKNNAISLFKGEQPIFPYLAVPANMSVEDALQFEKIMRTGDNAYYNSTDAPSFGQHMFYSMTRGMSSASILGANPSCAESNDQALMINYDGTICECACSYIQHDEKYLQQLLEQQKNEEYQISLIRKQYFINPLLDTTEDAIKDFNWYTLGGLRNTQSVQISLAMSMIKELALSHQVDYSYFTNPDKLLKHATSAGNIYHCTREQISDTKIPYLCTLNDCRKMFNGVLQHIAEIRTDEGKYRLEVNSNEQQFRE